MPLAPGRELVRLQHPEYSEHLARWQWLLDSLEGGERYRRAVYTVASFPYGGASFPYATAAPALTRRNLIRHKHEDDETDTHGTRVPNRDYQLRLERTPVPGFVAEAIESHLSEIYTKEIARDGPPELAAWWLDVDGLGTAIDDWMADTVAPLLLVLGQLDILCDRPPAPEGLAVRSRADVERLGLRRCLARVVLPENLPWWRLEPYSARYAEALVIEYHEDNTGLTAPFYRHWTPADSTLYDGDGRVVAQAPHPYGRVPIVRVYDRRRPRCRHVGQSRYESIAELQRESYNKESELILANTTHVHPLIMGPEDFCTPGNTVPLGPGRLLPKKKNGNDAGATYEGFEYVDVPQSPSESLRADLTRDRDAVDRAARLTKPAGAQGTAGTTVAQSGISKALDQKSGNALLTKLARVLAGAERQFAELALTVLAGGPPDPRARDTVKVVYPSSFNLLSAAELMTLLADFQELLAQAGECPETETLGLQKAARDILQGEDDATLARTDAEIADRVAEKAAQLERMREAPPPPPPPPGGNGMPPLMTPLAGGGADLQGNLAPAGA
jgi:hypothetical protein